MILRRYVEERIRQTCPDCGVGIGDQHIDGCDVEKCTNCLGQRLLCDCENHNKHDARWTGIWPGVIECIARGWFSKMTSDGWVQCSGEDEGAGPDLNRLAYFEQTGEDNMYSSNLKGIHDE